MVDDDLCCKSSADRPVGIGLFQGLLNTADILCTAVVKGSTETYDQKLVLSDLIRIAGIVCRSVSRVTAEIIGIREFAFHHCLLRICQGIPGSLCGLNIRIGRIRALLHIDFVDQCRAFCRKLFIRLRCFCCCSCNCCCLRCRSSCIRRYRLCSAACFGYSRAGIVCSRAALRTCTGSPAAAGKKSAGKHGGQQNRCQFSFHDFPPVEYVKMLSVTFSVLFFIAQDSRASLESVCCSRPVSLHGITIRRQTKSGWRVPPFILASLFQHVKNREFLTGLTIAEGRNTLGADAALLYQMW